MRFDEKRQISRLVETFVAQSNAAQRRGRAGRVREGVCFHLFTKQRHDTVVSHALSYQTCRGGMTDIATEPQMAEHPQPEMLRLSLQALALRIKIMKIGTTSIEDVLLRALDPPLEVNIQRAVSSLIEAKALTTAEEITPLGRHLAKLPMDVHLGKFLILSCMFNCLDAALTITVSSEQPLRCYAATDEPCTGYSQRQIALAYSVWSRVRSRCCQTRLQGGKLGLLNDLRCLLHLARGVGQRLRKGVLPSTFLPCPSHCSSRYILTLPFAPSRRAS